MSGSDVLEQYVLEMSRARGRDELSPDDDLIELGIVDSISIARIVQFVEETFAIELRDEDIVPEIFGTLARIRALVERRRSSAQVA